MGKRNLERSGASKAQWPTAAGWRKEVSRRSGWLPYQASAP